MTSDFLEEDEWIQTVDCYFRNDYRERGKIKWNGFFLSDHTAKMQQDSQLHENQERASWLEKQPLTLIREQVLLASQYGWRLRLQENTVDANRQIPLPIVGVVTDFFDGGFYLEELKVEWANIRFAEVQRGQH